MRTLPAGGFNNKQPIVLGKQGPPVPGTAMKRGIGTASGGSGRPMTAVSGAGFNSNKMTIGGGDVTRSISVTLEPKIET
jgi:hypothetical protein